MKALITKNYISFSNYFYGTKEQIQAQKDFQKRVKENQGNWIEVETKHLFDSQYNTSIGRLHDTWIDEIQDDERNPIDFPKCFFLKHPKGKDKIKDIRFEDHLKNERFLSCSSINGNYYRILRRSSIEFILVGELIYICNGYNYTLLKDTRLTPNEKSIVIYCANRIKEL